MDKEFKLASQLLLLLDSEQRWFTLAEVEKSLHISDKTIRKLVEEINRQLPVAMTIDVSRGKGIFYNAMGEVQPLVKCLLACSGKPSSIASCTYCLSMGNIFRWRS